MPSFFPAHPVPAFTKSLMMMMMMMKMKKVTEQTASFADFLFSVSESSKPRIKYQWESQGQDKVLQAV